MPYRLPPLSDEDYRAVLPLLRPLPSCRPGPVQSVPDGELWRGSVDGNNELSALWIRLDADIIGYVAFERLALPNVCGIHLKRGWISASYRGQGAFPELLREVSGGTTLIGDRDGMTEDAFRSMKAARGFTPSYLDQATWTRVRADQVSDDCAFGPGGSRWLLLLDLDRE